MLTPICLLLLSNDTESNNKTLIKLIKKKIKDNPRRWHEVLSEALWAHRISRHGGTKVTPFELVYGQEVVLAMEVNLDVYKLAKQNDLSTVDYHDLIYNIDEITDKRMQTFKKLRKTKQELPEPTTRRRRRSRSK